MRRQQWIDIAIQIIGELGRKPDLASSYQIDVLSYIRYGRPKEYNGNCIIPSKLHMYIPVYMLKYLYMYMYFTTFTTISNNALSIEWLY